MDAREAYHRRAYRVALLLTDSDAWARRVLERVARAEARPERTSDARFDRAVIQACRPIHEDAARARGDGLAPMFALDGAPAALWSAVHDLEPQAREAWVLRELEQMDEVRAARAMDCSRNALERIHLAAARTVLRDRVGAPYDEALASLRTALDGLDASPALAEIEGVLRAHARRSRIVTLVSWALLLAFFGALLFVLFDLLSWDEREAALRTGAEEALSNPIPEGAGAP